jgi:23S rRNA (adenine2030-N6)-methyltransferase
MLSYRHGFHAGNFADLLKHIVQVEILEHMGKKDKPYDYIDTHAGAGLYQLDTGMAAKNQEYLTGIDHVFGKEQQWPQLVSYLRQISAHNRHGQLKFYPGSPAIAAGLLRPQDKAWMFELHSTDIQHLRKNFAGNRQVDVRQQDGFKGLDALLPTKSRRAFILIDPPYEQKQDYQRVVDGLKLIHRKMATATVALWYPVVERARIDTLEKQIFASGIRNVVQFELGTEKDSSGHGMTSAGMIVVNPPWTLKEKMDLSLPDLARAVSDSGEGHMVSRILVVE